MIRLNTVSIGRQRLPPTSLHPKRNGYGIAFAFAFPLFLLMRERRLVSLASAAA